MEIISNVLLLSMLFSVVIMIYNLILLEDEDNSFERVMNNIRTGAFVAFISMTLFLLIN